MFPNMIKISDRDNKIIITIIIIKKTEWHKQRFRVLVNCFLQVQEVARQQWDRHVRNLMTAKAKYVQSAPMMLVRNATMVRLIILCNCTFYLVSIFD